MLCLNCHYCVICTIIYVILKQNDYGQLFYKRLESVLLKFQQFAKYVQGFTRRFVLCWRFCAKFQNCAKKMGRYKTWWVYTSWLLKSKSVMIISKFVERYWNLSFLTKFIFISHVVAVKVCILSVFFWDKWVSFDHMSEEVVHSLL